MRDLVGILTMQALEREICEARRGRRLELRDRAAGTNSLRGQHTGWRKCEDEGHQQRHANLSWHESPHRRSDLCLAVSQEGRRGMLTRCGPANRELPSPGTPRSLGPAPPWDR